MRYDLLQKAKVQKTVLGTGCVLRNVGAVAANTSFPKTCQGVRIFTPKLNHDAFKV